MTTNVKVFKSTDAGAPVLSGVAGSLIGLLSAILVTGYNSKSVTVAHSDGLATATCTSHGFVTGQCLLIAGAGQADYNGEKIISVIDEDTFSFSVPSETTSPATGNIVSLQPIHLLSGSTSGHPLRFGRRNEDGERRGVAATDSGLAGEWTNPGSLLPATRT